ncbi:DNA polymerase III subunit [Hydrogenophilus thiooxidans]|uniref:DNA polymerase III subunit n=1 Tax=Hydrogenophilus thiooxidans TaxID=2820326 RepID=UPI001C22E39F|nr:DNA polymerase III subunit delta' [Hydrogenophilus thiooxidans]
MDDTGFAYPWLTPWIQRFFQAWRQGRAPQALLLAGPEGIGKRHLAAFLARRWTCAAPPEAGTEPCGRCPSCTLDDEAAHPDRFALTAQPGTQGIPIDAVRALQADLALSAHGVRRAVVIQPAEAMNRYTANALLKILEEPPAAVLFILVSDAPGRLLPTILSRTQQWRLHPPPFAQAEAWLRAAWQPTRAQTEHFPEPQQAIAAALALHRGAPLAAWRFLSSGKNALRDVFVRDAADRVWRQPVAVASEWAQRLKAHEGEPNGLRFAELFRWYQYWLFDLLTLATLGDACANRAERLHFPDAAAQIAAVARRRASIEWFRIARFATALAPWVDHPLNTASLCETLWLNYCEGVA